MTILPVIDLLNGVVVRGLAGRRNEYRPMQSRWSTTADPLEVADGLRAAYGFRRFYIADLDGILRRHPNRDVYRHWKSAGYELLVDAGLQFAEDAQPILSDGVHAVIAGSETLSGPDTLAELIQQHGPDRIVFSLDLRHGVPQIAPGAGWRASDAVALAQWACDHGVEQMIVLDLADVGVGTGGSTAALCGEIQQLRPNLRLLTGGGVRGEDDLQRWAKTTVEELLVASALHDGLLSQAVVRQFQNRAT